MKLQIIYEDQDILVIDKPAGLVVNRSETIREETLQDWLSDYFNLGNDLGIGDRAGIVHRLDRETSGLLLVAKTQRAFENLQAQFKARTVQKAYLALVHGQVKDDKGSITGEIGRVGKFGKFGLVKDGRESVTQFTVEQKYTMTNDCFNLSIHRYKFTKSQINYLKNHAQEYTVLKIYPKTGRTHQVRVHLQSIGHPVVSDQTYAPKKLLKFDLAWCPRLFLHACALEIVHPVTKKPIKFTSDLPNDLKNAILNLEEIA
ncbi:RluA family pseudouridine synthase [Candidatus Curtissbacteria bacterium]|nr:RluA family pseudouridine synthase [Candidatus Curtissbacteria bacterium]